MGQRWWTIPAIALVAGCLLTGCGDPEVVPPPVPVPEITNPRDARGQDPCVLLDPAQLRAAGLRGPGRGSAVAEGPHCEWSSGAVSLAVTLYTSGGGLETLARNSEPSTARVRLASYPALETFTGRGEFCQYDVAVAPEQVVLASLKGGAPDSCSALQAVLPGVLNALPPYRR